MSSDEELLVETARKFLAEVEDLTPGKSLEERLNTTYGPQSEVYKELARLTRIGLRDGWLAQTEITGPNYRRQRLRDPSPALRYFSITAVYMDSQEERVLQGDYHSHPYGEINMVIPIRGDKCELAGLDGLWIHEGWTCPGPGSHHYPVVRGGALVALFFLPAGRISYGAKPGDPQPVDVGMRNETAGAAA